MHAAMAVRLAGGMSDAPMEANIDVKQSNNNNNNALLRRGLHSRAPKCKDLFGVSDLVSITLRNLGSLASPDPRSAWFQSAYNPEWALLQQVRFTNDGGLERRIMASRYMRLSTSVNSERGHAGLVATKTASHKPGNHP
jgi:hypothetical protein